MPLSTRWTRRQFHDRFKVKIHSFYGTSETGGISYDETDTRRGKPTVGRPLPGVAVDSEAGRLASPDRMPRVYVRSAAVSRELRRHWSRATA